MGANYQETEVLQDVPLVHTVICLQKVLDEKQKFFLLRQRGTASIVQVELLEEVEKLAFEFETTICEVGAL